MRTKNVAFVWGLNHGEGLRVTTFLFRLVYFRLNRKRGEAKMCTVLAWQNFCNQSDVADAIFNKVIGNFNPYCKNDKDPWAVESDLCSSYRMPYRNPECGSCSGKPKTCPPRKSAAGIKHGVLLNLLNILFYMTAILYLDNLMLRM